MSPSRRAGNTSGKWRRMRPRGGARGRWRTGAPRGTVTVSYGEGCERDAGCQAAHRAEAWRRDGDIAPYRNGTRAWSTRGAGVKPRTAVASRHGQWLGGAPRCGMPSRAPRRGAAARWGHRALPQRDRTTGHEGAHGDGTAPRNTRGTRVERVRAAAPFPTVCTEYAGCARGAPRAVRQGCAKVLRRQFCGGVSYSRRLRDGFPSPLNPKSFSYFRNTLWQIELF